VDEVDVEAVDLGRELRERVQSLLALPPVVVRRPVTRQRLHRGELHALRSVVDQLAGRPPGRFDAAAQLSELLFGNLDLERTYVGRGLGGRTHDNLHAVKGGGTTSTLV
jgi:hypothetical protein